MRYGIQVKTQDAQGVHHWRDVHPTRGAPYRWDTLREAQRMMRMCYPELIEGEQVRTVEVPE